MNHERTRDEQFRALDRYLSPEEAADVLGVSTRTVRRLIADGTLPAHRLIGGRRIGIKTGDVEKAMAPIPTTGDDLAAS